MVFPNFDCECIWQSIFQKKTRRVNYIRYLCCHFIQFQVKRDLLFCTLNMTDHITKPWPFHINSNAWWNSVMTAWYMYAHYYPNSFRVHLPQRLKILERALHLRIRSNTQLYHSKPCSCIKSNEIPTIYKLYFVDYKQLDSHYQIDLL